MKLDRNDGARRGKYAVVRLRDINATADSTAAQHLENLRVGGFVEYGMPGDEDEFFVIKLKDKYAGAALHAYAAAAYGDDREYANEVNELANRADNHPSRKKPD
jgi:hypothetical protein